MAKCGKCKETGVTLDHVRACYQVALVGAGARQAGYDQWALRGNSYVPITDEVTKHTANDSFRAMQQRETGAQAIERFNTARPSTSPDWELVNNLRREVAAHLPGERDGKKLGFYAVELGGVIKFYQVKKVLKGRWAGKVFVDAQASDETHSVRNPRTLAEVLGAIALDAQGAAERYAQEIGSCYACNRTLTDEESRRLGIGPVCRNK